MEQEENMEMHEYETYNPFVANIDDKSIKSLLRLSSINNIYKILCLLGIGVFTNEQLCYENILAQENIKNEENNVYVEIMRELASSKSLYLLLAHSDYIYGTNYQFSHCYLGKDMSDLSQEKIIQCIGRVGRQEKNQHYSFRFRSKKQINTLYSIPDYNIEAQNMNKLFV